MHSFPAYLDVCEDDQLRFANPLSHQMHRTYEGQWTPIDPALYNIQFEQQQKQLHHEFAHFQQQSVAYPATLQHISGHIAPVGHLSGWNGYTDVYKNMRYNSPGCTFGGNMSESSNDYAVSPEMSRQRIVFNNARYISPPTETHFSQQSWTSGSSFVMTPVSTPTSTQTPSIALKELDLQNNQDFQFELQEDDLRTQIPTNAPEELELSESIATLTTSSQAHTTFSSQSHYETDSSISSPALDNDSDSDFNPKKRASKLNLNARSLCSRPMRRPSSSSYPTLDTNNRVHKTGNPRTSFSKEKSKPKPLPQLDMHKNNNTSSKAPKSFPCSFHTFGCPSTFANKNEWKRHVTSQHLQLGSYRCDLGTCNPDNNVQTHSSHSHGLGQGNRGRGHNKRRSISATYSHLSQDDDGEEVRIYNDFNRKDLFTQHCRRMHGPARHLVDNATQTNQAINARLRAQGRRLSTGSGNGKPMSTKDDDAAFEEELEVIRARCWTTRRYAPSRSSCGFCGKLFEADAHVSGTDNADGKAEERAWEERMEHLGRHYERDGCSPSMEGIDPDLREWGLNEGILAIVEGKGAWLVGYEVPGSEHDQDQSGDGVESRREGLRRRGPRRKASNPVTVKEVDAINNGPIKIENTLSRLVKLEEDDSDADAMADDD